MSARKFRRAQLVVACIACATACGKASRDLTAAAEVPAKYREIFAGWVESGEADRVWAGFPYETIRVDRSGVWPRSPNYQLVFHRGGRAEFRGVVDGVRGVFESKIDLFSFGKLCYAFEQAGFERLRDLYSDEGIDAGEATFEVTWKGGSKRVVDHGEVGPIALWTIGAAIDGVRGQMEWTKVK